MEPRIDGTQFGSVTIDGKVFEHDVFKRRRCQVKLLPTPEMIPVWNRAEGAVIGLVHVTC
jgi:hypothetical protein